MNLVRDLKLHQGKVKNIRLIFEIVPIKTKKERERENFWKYEEKNFQETLAKDSSNPDRNNRRMLGELRGSYREKRIYKSVQQFVDHYSRSLWFFEPFAGLCQSAAASSRFYGGIIQGQYNICEPWPVAPTEVSPSLCGHRGYKKKEREGKRKREW